MGSLRFVAPAGAPLPLRVVLPSLVDGGPEGLADILRARLGVRNCFFVSSGRAALTVLLTVLQRASDRREVLVPAYTCFSVPSAVVRAGLRIRLCDVDPNTLDVDLDALARVDLSRVLCIVPSGLYGMPGGLVSLENIARRFGTTLVDDAAQCLGATHAGRPCGTFGDAGFYSLGRGKGITTMGGGILVTQHDDIASRIEEEMHRLRHASAHEVCAAIGASVIYSGMLQPSRYWLIERMPFVELGVSKFDPDEFPLAQLSAYQQRLAQRLLPLVDAYNAIRRAHAARLRCGLKGADGIELLSPVPGTDPVYLRFPVLTTAEHARVSLIHRLRQAGIGVSTSYPTSIRDIPGITRYLATDQAPCPVARSVASRIFTLPTHPGVTPADVERMVAIIREHGGIAGACDPR